MIRIQIKKNPNTNEGKMQLQRHFTAIQLRILQEKGTKMNSEFDSAVRDYHYNHRYWSPQENEIFEMLP